MLMDMSVQSCPLPLSSDKKPTCFTRFPFFFSEIACKDKTSRPKEVCRVMGSGCGTTSDADGAFNMARADYELCLKSCKFCVA